MILFPVFLQPYLSMNINALSVCVRVHVCFIFYYTAIFFIIMVL